MDWIFLGCVLLIVGSKIYDRITINKLRDLTEKSLSMYDESNKDKDELYVFCLRCVAKISVDNEDYETASKCRDLLVKYEKVKKE